MSYTFTDDVADETARGRVKGDNPFDDVVASIALKTKDGKPLAKAFVEEFDGTDENFKVITNRLTRLLREAGLALETPVSVPVRFEVKGNKEIKVKFWTTAKVVRPRKEKTENAPVEETAESK